MRQDGSKSAYDHRFDTRCYVQIIAKIFRTTEEGIACAIAFSISLAWSLSRKTRLLEPQWDCEDDPRTCSRIVEGKMVLKIHRTLYCTRDSPWAWP
jgi:hypothetical protein